MHSRLLLQIRAIAYRGLALAVSSTFFVTFFAAIPVIATDGPSLLIEGRIPLPEPIEWALDLRWASDHSVLISAATVGVVEVPVGGGGSAAKTIIPGGSSHREARRAGDSPVLWLASRLALSADYLLTSASVFSYSWRTWPEGRIKSVPHDVIVDLDVHGDRLLLLGAVKDGDGSYASDGAIAWLGKVNAGAEGLKPVYYSRAGAGALPMARCCTMDIGAVRFLADGSFVLVPGVEAGVFWYDAEGQLMRTWESEAVGLADICRHMPLQKSMQLAADPDALARWINQHRTLDEILILPQGPALLVRETLDGVTRWHLRVLGRDGSLSTIGIPLTSTSGRAFLKGDLRGRRLALLRVELGREQPVAPPGLILARVPE